MYSPYIIKYIVAGILFAISSAYNYCFAQLDVCINTALSNNVVYRAQQFKAEISNKDIVISKSYLFPKIKFENSYFIANGGREIAFASGDLINPIYNQLYQLTGNNAYNVNIPNFEEQFYPNNFYRSGLNMSWGIFSKKAIFKYKSAQSLSEISVIQLESAKKKLIKDVKVSYFEFYKLNKLLAFQDSLISYLNKLSTKTKKLINFGYAESIDLDQLKYEIAKQKQQKLELTSNYEILLKQFKNLLGKTDFTCDFVDDDANLEDFTILNQFHIDKNSDIKTLVIKQRLIDLEKKRNNNWIPDASISIKSGFEGTLSSINTDTDYFYLGTFNLNWSLFEGGKSRHLKNQIEIKNKLNAIQKDNYTNIIKLDLNERLKNLNNEKNSLFILTQKKELSFKILNHQKKKYLQGDLDITDLLNFKKNYEEDVTKYYQTKISYIQHIIYYNWLVQS